MNVHRCFTHTGMNWKQPRSPSVGEWLKNWQYPYHGIRLNNTKDGITDTIDNFDESQGTNTE